jgi:hypothetical protein
VRMRCPESRGWDGSADDVFHLVDVPDARAPASCHGEGRAPTEDGVRVDKGEAAPTEA